MKSHYLTALEIESKADEPLSDMEREAYLEAIQDLRESVRSTHEMVKSLQYELSRSNRNQEESNQLINDLRSTIADLQKRLEERDREIADLRNQNNRHNKMSFGSKSISRKYQRPSGTISREEEKEACEGPEAAVFGTEQAQQGDGVYHEHYRPLHPEVDNMMPHVNVIPGTHLTPELFADLVSDVYQLHTPVYRERIRNLLDKFTVSDNTLSNAIKVVSKMFSPVLLKLKSRLLQVKSVLNIDETWVQVRIKIKNDGTKLGHYYKKYVWALANKLENITYFFYDNDEDDSRGSRPIESFLGSVQSDGYVVYKHLAAVNLENEFIFCWAHVRNKFAMTYESNKDLNADWFVKKIGELYRIESECVLKRLKPDEIRKRRSQDDVTRILVERAIRPFTVHRKNSLFFSSEEGVETALTFFTLIETCKNVGLNARDYIATTVRLLMDGNENYDDLVPMSLAK